MHSIPASRPAVDAGYVWYQASGGGISYRDYNDWNTTHAVTANLSSPVIIAPIGTRGYGLWEKTGRLEIFALSQPGGSYSVLGNVTFPQRLDALQVNGKEYLYSMDRDAGRIIEVKHSGNATMYRDSYGVGKAIIPIDAIDEDYGLSLAYASVINGKVVVTGRLTRTSDDTPVSMDVYAIGPEHFSFGRDMFIQGGSEVNGKMLLVGDKLIVSGAQQYWIADATVLFGYDNPELKLTTSDLSLMVLNEAEGRSSELKLDMSPDLTDEVIAAGSDVEVEMAYNDHWSTLTTSEVAAVDTTTDTQGKAKVVSGIGKSARRLGGWSPEQGVYIPSQARVSAVASDLCQLVVAAGQTKEINPEGSIGSGVYNDTDTNWEYVGTWGADPSQGTPSSIHYSNAAGAYAQFAFFGTGFIFRFTKYTDRAVHDIWIDGVKVASINAYSPTKIQGSYTSPVLAQGPHTFKVSRGDPQTNYIDVDEIEIIGDPVPAITAAGINELTVLYSVARAARRRNAR